MADISALCRRYEIDAVRGLVSVARLDPLKHAAAVNVACRTLLEFGHPGHLKGSAADEAVNVLHLHLLAVAGAGRPGVPDPAQLRLGRAELVAAHEAADDTEDEPIREDLLPPVNEALPHEALPLWDASRAANDSGGA